MGNLISVSVPCCARISKCLVNLRLSKKISKSVLVAATNIQHNKRRIDKEIEGRENMRWISRVIHLASLEHAHSRRCIRIALCIQSTFLPGKGRKKILRSGFIRGWPVLVARLRVYSSYVQILWIFVLPVSVIEFEYTKASGIEQGFACKQTSTPTEL